MIPHLHFQSSPLSIVKSRLLCDKEIYFKRDDLFLKAGGGSKARMLQYILADISKENYDVIVTAGGPCSNFNRACALQCAEIGIPMHLIAYTDHEDEFEKSENFFICQLAGVKITKCEKTKVKETIESVLDDYKRHGIKAKSIYGGGRSIEGISAYYFAVEELLSQMNSYQIENLFIACGTGTTVAGIIAGFQKYSPSTKIHAISIARKRKEELAIIEEDLTWMKETYKENFNTENLTFYDEFILGEYGAVNSDLLNFIYSFICQTGILVDPIYSGKALWGMSEILKKKNCDNNLFWHTGAIYTLLSNKNKFEIENFIINNNLSI